ncbi:hypothetical protein JCM10213_007260 [Rhodosporidiobolus nylandii]
MLLGLLKTDRVSITTADQAVLHASRAQLVASSSVFADLLSLPAPAEGDEIALMVQETGAELSVLLAVMSGQEQRRKTALLPLGEEGWSSLARLTDKYDVDSARLACQSRFWELLYKEQSPLTAFTLATYLNDASLIAETPPAAIADLLNWKPCGASPEWQANTSGATASSSTPRTPPNFGDAGEYCDPAGPCNPFTMLRAYQDGLRFALLHFQAQPEFAAEMESAAVGWTLCGHHGQWLVQQAEHLEEAFWADPPKLQ